MKISIIVPVYNVEAYIDRCFKSIVSQTYDNNNIECLFIDDCSPDKSYSILEKRVKEYSGEIKFTIVRHQENKGLSGARNSGIMAATGDYIYFLDSDDEITSNCISSLSELANKYKNVEIVQGNTQTIPYLPQDYWRDIKKNKFPEYVENNLWIKKHFLTEPRIPVNAWNKLIKREFLINNNLFFKESIIHEDEHWMFFLAKKINSIAFTNNYCYVHYIVNGSIMQSKNTSKSLKSIAIILNDFYQNIDSCLISSQKRYIHTLINKNLLMIYNMNIEYGILKEYKTFIKKYFSTELKKLNIIESTLLLMYFLPYPILNSFAIQKIFAGMLKLL